MSADSRRTGGVSRRVMRRSRIFTPEVIDDIHMKAELGRYRMRGFSIFKRIPHWDELMFLPGTLTRFVIEGYREKCVTKTVQKISGLNINHFIGIDFQGFKGMVDAVQGVEVCVEHPLKDTVLGTIVPQAGKAVNLTGDEALAEVRSGRGGQFAPEVVDAFFAVLALRPADLGLCDEPILRAV